MLVPLAFRAFDGEVIQSQARRSEGNVQRATRLSQLGGRPVDRDGCFRRHRPAHRDARPEPFQFVLQHHRRRALLHTYTPLDFGRLISEDGSKVDPCAAGIRFGELRQTAGVMQPAVDGERVVAEVVQAEDLPAVPLLAGVPEPEADLLQGVVGLRPQIDGPADTPAFQDEGAGIHVAVADGGTAALDSEVKSVGIVPGGAPGGDWIRPLPRPVERRLGRALKRVGGRPPQRDQRQEAVDASGALQSFTKEMLRLRDQTRKAPQAGHQEKGGAQVGAVAPVGEVVVATGGSGRVQHEVGAGEQPGRLQQAPFRTQRGPQPLDQQHLVGGAI